MKKIPTVFARDENRRYVTPEVTPGCEWVLNGEGTATRKLDGTCVRISHVWYDGPQVAVETRREVKPGKEPPQFFDLVEHDPVTGKSFGWEPYGVSGFAKYVDEALGYEEGDDDLDPALWPEGTYELCGPKINGNPEGFERHVLVRHGSITYADLNHPNSYEHLRAVITALPWEGIVWHHPDGRMAKLKRRDFPKEPA